MILIDVALGTAALLAIRRLSKKYLPLLNHTSEKS